MKASRAFLLAVTHMMMGAVTALGQNSSAVAFEGHAFDAKTLRPLANVVVNYQIDFSNGAQTTIAAVTNANGFYQLDFIPPDPSLVTGSGLFARCNTTRGQVFVPGITYDELRAEVYRRDFYVTLPKRVTKCTP